MKRSQLVVLVVPVVIVVLLVAGLSFYLLSLGAPSGSSSPPSTSANSSSSGSGASVDGVQIVSDNVTLSLGTGTWQIALKNTGNLDVTSIVAYLQAPTRATLCSGAQPANGLFFKNCPANNGAPLPPGATITGSSTGAGPESTTAGMPYPVTIHLAFSNGQVAWLNSTVTSRSG